MFIVRSHPKTNKGDSMVNVELHGFDTAKAASIREEILHQLEMWQPMIAPFKVTIFNSISSDIDGCATYFRVFHTPDETSLQKLIDFLESRFTAEIEIIQLSGFRKKRLFWRPASAQPIVDPAPTGDNQDMPMCDVCGAKMFRNGSCYKCHQCGSSKGCS